AGCYTDNQPDFAWIEPYETKEFSQFWYPISKIGAPDFANIDCALKLGEKEITIQSTRSLGNCQVVVSAGGETLLQKYITLQACQPVSIAWKHPKKPVKVIIKAEDDEVIGSYSEDSYDTLNMPEVKKDLPFAEEMQSADELYLAGVHVVQYRDPATMPDAYWLEALKRNPKHAPSLLAMAKYSYEMYSFEAAKKYAEKAIQQLTMFNKRTQSGDAYYTYALILTALGDLSLAYNYFYKASWNGGSISKAMVHIACLDLIQKNYKSAAKHAELALANNIYHPLASAVLILTYQKTNQKEKAMAIAKEMLKNDPLNLLLRFLSGFPRDKFFGEMYSNAAQSVLDIVFDITAMGEYQLALELLQSLIQYRPDAAVSIIFYTIAYYKNICGLDFSDELEKAEKAPIGSTFPFRLKEIEVLNFAIENNSGKAMFLLGCLMYSKRHYEYAAKLFESDIQTGTADYMAYRCLASLYFSHLNKKNEALPLMEKALDMSGSQQIIYECFILMDKLSFAPRKKIEFAKKNIGSIGRDDILIEVIKAYNQNEQPQKALELLAGHTFVPCEGGEHAIADQYMYAYYLLGQKEFSAGKYEDALKYFTSALTLPQNLGAGIWNRCKYYPYKIGIAQCYSAMGVSEKAKPLYEEIMNTKVDFFSNMHLKELPYYQAISAIALGMKNRAQNIMTAAKREWSTGFERKDNGFYAATPFFIDFIESAATLRRAHYLYLNAFVELYLNNNEGAKKMFQESCQLDSDNMFCNYYAKIVY
ncbi:MAG: tetratricopeptide repeat protein, partial [Oscillospiraceae bacterium]